MKIIDKVFGKPTDSEDPKTADEQPVDTKKLVAFVKQKLDDARQSNSRVSHEGIWMTNIAYLLGYDSLYYDTKSRQFRSLNNTSATLKRNRVHANKILPSAQNRLARLCKNPPRYDVRPNSQDAEDKDAARLGVQTLGMIWDVQKINEKRIPLYMWVQQCGHAYIKVSWDTELGEPLYNPITGKIEGNEGDVRVEPVSAFEVFVDPLARTLDDAHHVIHAKVRRLDYFRTHYQNGHMVKEEDAWLLSAQYDLRINSINTQSGGGAPSQNGMKDSAIEVAYYERKSRKFPNGRMIVTANGVLLESKELPCGEIPFAKFDDVVVGGKFYSESVITHARPLQDQYNQTLNRIATWSNKLLAGKYLAPKGHGMAQEAFTDQSGEIVEFNPIPTAIDGGRPTPVQTPMIPQWAFVQLEAIENQIYDVFGVNEASRGQLPSASIPAIGMQFLVEQDDTRIGVITENHEHAWARVGKLILKQVDENYKTPRLLKVAGKSMEYTVKKITGEQLKRNFDVIVLRGSTVPGSKVLKRQEILNAYREGLLGDPVDAKVREKVLGMLEFGDVGEMWTDYAIDMAQIKEQIEMIKKGEVPPISEFDNNPLHIQIKNRFRKSDEFKRLDSVARAILDKDLNERLDLIAGMIDPSADTELADALQQKADPALAMVEEGAGDMLLEDLPSMPQAVTDLEDLPDV